MFYDFFWGFGIGDLIILFMEFCRILEQVYIKFIANTALYFSYLKKNKYIKKVYNK